VVGVRDVERAGDAQAVVEYGEHIRVDEVDAIDVAANAACRQRRAKAQMTVFGSELEEGPQKRLAVALSEETDVMRHRRNQADDPGLERKGAPRVPGTEDSLQSPEIPRYRRSNASGSRSATDHSRTSDPSQHDSTRASRPNSRRTCRHAPH